MPNPSTTWTASEQVNREAFETQSLGLKKTEDTTSPNTEAMTPAAADTNWTQVP